jgi:hypothetical protein
MYTIYAHWHAFDLAIEGSIKVDNGLQTRIGIGIGSGSIFGAGAGAGAYEAGSGDQMEMMRMCTEQDGAQVPAKDWEAEMCMSCPFAYDR